MYVGVDVGGTKTLVAVLDEHGVINEQTKFPTPKNYDHWLLELRHALAHFETKDFKAAGAAIPGRIDRTHGRAISLGNLPWHNVPVQADCERALHCPVVVENDANLAGLSEAMLHKNSETVLYITVSTGIGTGIVHNQVLDPTLLDSEGGHMLLPHRGKLIEWEQFASGKAIFEHFGKHAADLHDQKDWEYIARNLGVGLFELIAIVQPNLVVIGGSIGSYFERFGSLLAAELKKHELPIVPIPNIVQAARPEQAVIFGCYDIAKQQYGHGKITD